METEIELKEQDMGIVMFQGDDIDFTDAVQEQVMLALPMAPVCRENCRGLCTLCGSNLNKGDCGCNRTPSDSRFDVLSSLSGKLKDQ